MEQNREPRNKSMHMGQLICNKRQRTRLYNGERTVSSIDVGKTGQPHAKE